MATITHKALFGMESEIVNGTIVNDLDLVRLPNGTVRSAIWQGDTLTLVRVRTQIADGKVLAAGSRLCGQAVPIKSTHKAFVENVIQPAIAKRASQPRKARHAKGSPEAKAAMAKVRAAKTSKPAEPTLTITASDLRSIVAEAVAAALNA